MENEVQMGTKKNGTETETVIILTASGVYIITDDDGKELAIRQLFEKFKTFIDKLRGLL
jgi:hypothetical protein